MSEQLSLFDLIRDDSVKSLKPGDYVETVGRELSFDEITKRVGQLIIIEQATESHEWYKVVQVEKIYIYPENGNRRLIYYDGQRQRGLVDEMYFAPRYKGRFPVRVYEIC